MPSMVNQTWLGYHEGLVNNTNIRKTIGVRRSDFINILSLVI